MLWKIINHSQLTFLSFFLGLLVGDLPWFGFARLLLLVYTFHVLKLIIGEIWFSEFRIISAIQSFLDTPTALSPNILDTRVLRFYISFFSVDTQLSLKIFFFKVEFRNRLLFIILLLNDSSLPTVRLAVIGRRFFYSGVLLYSFKR